MIWQFLSWYLIIQLITVLTVPLAVRLFANLDDRGYAFTKSLGILLIGFVYWFGYSFGLLRNETGGVWLALILIGLLSIAVGRPLLDQWRQNRVFPLRWRHVISVEVIFLLAFAFWAYVRAHDPSVDHTEEPMDLMFMNSIWVSPTFPPHDAWLGGYPISYYYFGYWLLTTLGRLAGQPPEIAYVLGQASWYGLLWIGCYGIVYNLLAQRMGGGIEKGKAIAGGVFGALIVAFAGNLQGYFEFLQAKGIASTGLARWFNVKNFPGLIGPEAGQTGVWHVSFDWWWWRASRVISDRWLTGDHMEVIDEFPIFSYILGDNHPHVTAMPIAILVIALALNLFLQRNQLALPINRPLRRRRENVTDVEQDGRAVDDPSYQEYEANGWLPPLLRSPVAIRTYIATTFPLGALGAMITVIAVGSLIFLNTWDFPFYWLLLGFALLVLIWRNLGATTALHWGQRWQQTVTIVIISLVALAVGSWLLYYPYLLTAQSQAGGVVPNLFNPTRLPQFLLMFGFALAGVIALLGHSWQEVKQLEATTEAPQTPLSTLGIFGGLVLGFPAFFLGLSTILAINTPRGRQVLTGNMPLPEGAASYLPFILARWGANFWPFLLVGILIAVTLWLIWRYLQQFSVPGNLAHQNDTLADEAHWQRRALADVFVLTLALIGLLLIFAPEFVYLRDNFGTRMNTVFKFYYQGWLLLGLTVAYTIVTVGSQVTKIVADSGKSTLGRVAGFGTIIAVTLSFIMVVQGLFYPVMAIYSKTGGFGGEATFNSIAYVAQYSPAEWAAIEWVRTHTPYDAIVLESKGSSYYATHNRMSTMTGRQTLMGWDGHESQWRGKAFGEMAQGRDQALEIIYRGGAPEQIAQVLDQWQIDYVYVGPAERDRYGLTPQGERNLAGAMDLAFEQDNVRIYQRRMYR